MVKGISWDVNSSTSFGVWDTIRREIYDLDWHANPFLSDLRRNIQRWSRTVSWIIAAIGDPVVSNENTAVHNGNKCTNSLMSWTATHLINLNNLFSKLFHSKPANPIVEWILIPHSWMKPRPLPRSFSRNSRLRETKCVPTAKVFRLLNQYAPFIHKLREFLNTHGECGRSKQITKLKRN